MMVADSDVLIDFLRGRSPWAGRIRLEIKTGQLATTAINSFELLSGAKSIAEQEKLSRLLAAVTVLGLSAEASERQKHDVRSKGKDRPSGWQTASSQASAWPMAEYS
jgi:predicted nucleic acid-binding protein